MHNAHVRISPSEAYEMMRVGDVLILDVRSQDEFNDGHIYGAVLLPEDEIRERAFDVIISKSQTVLLYCRSGRRSDNAARALSEMGFLYVFDFGGILDWPYEVITTDGGG